MAYDKTKHVYVLKHAVDGFITKGSTPMEPIFAKHLNKATTWNYASFAKKALRDYNKGRGYHAFLCVVRVRLDMSEVDIVY